MTQTQAHWLPGRAVQGPQGLGGAESRWGKGPPCPSPAQQYRDPQPHHPSSPQVDCELDQGPTHSAIKFSCDIKVGEHARVTIWGRMGPLEG